MAIQQMRGKRVRSVAVQVVTTTIGRLHAGRMAKARAGGYAHGAPMYGCVPPKRNALAGALTDLVKGSDAVGGAVSALSGRHTRSRRGSSTPHQSF